MSVPYPPLTNVVRGWACLAPCERAACALFVIPEYPTGYVLPESLQLVIEGLSDFDPGKRYDAFLVVYNVSTQLRIVDGRRRPVHPCDQVWMYDLQQCQAQGECGGFVDFCEQLDFVNQP